MEGVGRLWAGHNCVWRNCHKNNGVPREPWNGALWPLFRFAAPRGFRFVRYVLRGGERAHGRSGRGRRTLLCSLASNTGQELIALLEVGQGMRVWVDFGDTQTLQLLD